ncbi:50S ribosomal protein L6 [candidate division WWE3 bacterium RIFOXYC1_FULL_40_10]|uniref:Large ribosomal subunit protein uL6 n=1 Tax=candidate division WWE3 bacterium RIFOXYA2_FULL_46_9 TaxID=1802636 RepID=A0A1F4VYP8_UNCKA|nr:MAG: 50S ribosomal protein L6 [candidate division WWE3 bacterium RIFOXYB1_FULL_40_22]OGC61855.1 MAG: 50S ribosomal protein L6 [candidate division WWE3 bacterium RIFOXYA1_FULL_40_11]OGC62220.1 MAG: 50S ribosomal protein L6 [candidate division WWE3 bacterium RIFOXYA2_FULL_46_9]OGC64327.1 MAG: 50S ribosomal protein L6 [candidate division WWE3 bacterium RIFOXYB2_FULL_41_6]OGC66238.1 MAG: 50S ribosomal protein L6 [candidate division WWE3 bacterium RIFOXYC1_FULL_40_10]OGC67844.1 MAG: 50S ribosoma
MSRIGRLPIKIPTEVKISIDGQVVSVKGPKGDLTLTLRPEIKVENREGSLVLSVAIESKNSPAYWGLYRALLNSMVEGVTRGYTKKLELIGVGYRAKQSGNDGVSLTLGFSHPIEFKAPAGVTIKVEDNQHVIIEGADKQKVGEVAATLRKYKKPEPYKGKGIKYENEVVRRKAGKAAKTGA